MEGEQVDNNNKQEGRDLVSIVIIICAGGIFISLVLMFMPGLIGFAFTCLIFVFSGGFAYIFLSEIEDVDKWDYYGLFIPILFLVSLSVGLLYLQLFPKIDFNIYVWLFVFSMWFLMMAIF
ncbi:MAG: hypothetical protein JSV56_07315, partial [Methanomassiliicoccales archaeon]